MEITMQKAGSFADQGEKEWPVIPEKSLVECEVVEVRKRELSPEFRAKYSIRDEFEINFHFKVIEGEYENSRIFGTAKPYLDDSDGCRLRFWLQEILGVNALPADYVFRLNEDGVADDRTGLRCRVLVKNRTKGDGTKAHQVGEVLRSEAARSFPTEDAF